MKKTVSVNLNGQVFTIDEDAYIELHTYLDAVAGQFSNSEESEEIISDVEARIAELFGSYISTSKQSITMNDVQKVIEIMGKPNDYIQNEEQSSRTDKDSQSYGRYKKRLYRDPENRILGGVAGGIAAWADIEAVIVLAFFVFSFYIFGPLLYLVLWIIIPLAKTPSQRLEMRGEDVNLNNIEKIIKEEFRQVKESLKNLKKKETSQRIKNEVTHSLSGFIRILSIFAKIILAGIMAFTLLAFMIFIGIMVKIIPLDLLNTHCHGLVSIQTFINSIFTDDSRNLLYWGIMLFVGSIFISIIINLAKILTGNTRKWWIVNSFFTIINITGLIFIIVAGIQEAENFSENTQVSKKITLLKSNEDSITIKVNVTDLYYKKTWDFESNHKFSFPIGSDRCNYNDGKISIYGKPSLRFSQSNNDSIYIEVIKKANGKDNPDAKRNAEFINYSWRFDKNIIILDEVFSIINSKWRNQNAEIVLYLPEKCKITFDENAKKISTDFDPNTTYSLMNGNLHRH